ncbi:MAG: hypothetical protein WAU81_09765 [Candidatus Aminicenantales bacterium]
MWGFLLLAGVPGAGLAQEDFVRSLPAVDDLANPILSSKSDWEKVVLRYDSLAIRIADRLLTVKQEKDTDQDAENAVTLAQSLVVRFLDFSLQLPDHEQRELIFDQAGIILNLPATLDGEMKKRIAGIARRSYEKVTREWRDGTGLPVPPGHIFLKIFTSPEEMNRRYGLEAATMGVAFPCRFIAAALRLDQAGSLVRQELENTLAHEFVHVFCYTALGFSRIGRLPLWFHEGVAMELSGQTQIHHVVQDATGTFILTLTSPEDYLKYHRVFRFLREKFGPEMLGAFISRALITAELSGTEEKSLLLQSEDWFRAKRDLEWLILLLTVVASLLAYKLARSKKILISMAVVLTGLLALSFTPYYAYSRLRYGIISLILGVLLYLAYKNLRISFRAARLLQEAQRFEDAGDDIRALIALKSFLRIERDDPLQRWIDRGKVERSQEKLLEVERRVVRKCLSEAARFEEQLDFPRAIHRYRVILDTVTGLPEEKEEARQNLERVKAVGQLFSFLSQESDKRPSS